MLTIRQAIPDDFPAQDNLFQTGFWGNMKTACGQQAVFFLVETVLPDSKPLRFPFMLLLRETADGYTYAYAPRAPSVTVADEFRGTLMEALAGAVRPWLPADCVCLRFDPPWKSFYSAKHPAPTKELAELRMNFGTSTARLKKPISEHLCPDTVVINLALPPERILSSMRQTTRNSIRKAYRSKVNFAVRGKGTLESWHRLYTDTAKRKHFYYESLPYFRRLFTEKKERLTGKNGTVPLSAPPPDPEFHILTARKDNVLLSGIVLALCGRTAYYMYAGSSLAQRELMPNYGLQWEAMLFARRKGCTAYDLMGIPPNGSKAHPMAGLYIFKTGFGGDHVRYCGAWDYLYDEEAYRYFCQEEQLSSLQPHTVL